MSRLRSGLLLAGMLAIAGWLSAETRPGAARYGALAGERVVLEKLTGVRFVAAPDEVVAGEAIPAGVDTARVPQLRHAEVEPFVRAFLDQPASFESLNRLVEATMAYLKMSGHPFVTVYLPPQDITGGGVQLVVTPGILARPLAIEGAKYFSEAHYRAALRQPVGGPIDAAGLTADVDRLNRNPFRRATIVARPGATRGATELVLRVDEQRPWRVFAGYNNTGSLVSDEDRLVAGFSWGNAFGRGDLLDYQFSGSPDFETSVTHSLNYGTELPWGHALRVSGAYSELTGRVAAPLSLSGYNAQLGLHYEVPLRPLRPKVTQGLALGFDFKASNNNLLFAEFPITDNLTHIVQFNAVYSLGFTDRLGQTEVSLGLLASPGGLTSRNHTSYFNLSRALARPDYLYGQLNVRRQQRLPRNFSWSMRGQLQVASTNLLGSEQMAGGGSASVRGYEEGEAYGDQGVLLSHELALPPLSPGQRWKWRDSLQGFVFQDFVTLGNVHRLAGERRWTDLHSVGMGVRYQVKQNFSLEFTQGWQLRDSGTSRSGDNHRAHVSAQVSY